MNYRLKRDGWHFKLQKWTFGNDIERMSNMCPYFWLTNFCIMAAPFVLLWRIAARIFGAIARPINYVFDLLFARIESRRQHRVITFVDGMSDWQAYCLYRTIYTWCPGYAVLNTVLTTNKFYNMRESTRKNLHERFNEWKSRHEDDWEDILKREYEHDVKAKADIEKANAERKNRLYQIANKTKLLVLLPIGTVLIYLTYYVGVGILFIMENPMALAFLAGLAAVLIIMVLVIILKLICKEGGRVPRYTKAVLGPVFRLFRLIGSVLVFFGMNIKLLYKNFCPQIEWED